MVRCSEGCSSKSRSYQQKRWKPVSWMPDISVSGAKGTLISWVQPVTPSGILQLTSSSKRKRHLPFRLLQLSRTSWGRGYSNWLIVFLSLGGDRDQDASLASLFVVIGECGFCCRPGLAGAAQGHAGTAESGARQARAEHAGSGAQGLDQQVEFADRDFVIVAQAVVRRVHQFA